MATQEKKSMASNASKTLRDKRASKISKSYAGSVLAKTKFKSNRTTKKQKKEKKKHANNKRVSTSN